MNPKYKDLLHTPWPPEGEEEEDMNERAGQFAPFSALTGYDGVIDEAGRLTQMPVFLTEESLHRFNETLNRLQEEIACRPRIRMTVYYDDERKEGGRFEEVVGNLKRIAACEGGLILTDGREIPFFRIVELEEEEEE